MSSIDSGTRLFYPVNISSDPAYLAVTDPTVAKTFTWFGLPAGSYRLESPRISNAHKSRLHGHARLTYPLRNPSAYGGVAHAASSASRCWARPRRRATSR